MTYHNICKATTVTHTKRIDRNLLPKQTSFVCYTSSVLRKKLYNVLGQLSAILTRASKSIPTPGCAYWNFCDF